LSGRGVVNQGEQGNGEVELQFEEWIGKVPVGESMRSVDVMDRTDDHVGIF